MGAETSTFWRVGTAARWSGCSRQAEREGGRVGKFRGVSADDHRLCRRHPVDDELRAAGLQGMARGNAIDFAAHVYDNGDELHLVDDLRAAFEERAADHLQCAEFGDERDYSGAEGAQSST